MTSTSFKSSAHARSAARSQAYEAGAFVLVIATAVILAALAFEHIGGYLPCPLCLQQRYAYYAGIPLAFLALVAVSSGRGQLAAVLFALICLAFLVNAGLGGYQAGAEWKYWPGPSSCGTLQGIDGSGRGILDKLATAKVIKCDEAQWRLFALSFAGWNAVVSVVLAIAALKAAFAAGRRD